MQIQLENYVASDGMDATMPELKRVCFHGSTVIIHDNHISQAAYVSLCR